MQDIQQETLSKIINSSGSGGLFGLSMWGLVAGLAFSTIGYFYFRAGKRENDLMTLGTGVALMVFPYFITKTLYIVVLGAGIMAFHYFSDKT